MKFYNYIAKDYKPPKPILWFIFLFGVILYANTYNHGYVLDDLLILTKNKVTQKGIEAIPTIFTSAYRYGYGTGKREKGLYRPLSVVTFALETEFFGDNNIVYHINNILLYALSGVVLFLTLLKLFRNYNVLVSILICLFYIAHPIHTEVVANIKSRDEILGFLFLLSSLFFLLTYMDRQRRQDLGVSLLMFLLALLSKEAAVTFIGIIPLIFYFFVNSSKKRKVVTWGSFMIVFILYLAFRISVVPGVEGGIGQPIIQNSLLAASSAGERWATTITVIGHAIKLLIFPHPLIYDYSYNQFPIVNWTSLKVIFYSIVITTVLVLALLRFKKKDPASFGIIFYCITISLTSNVIIAIAWTFGERFLYVPSLGFCIVLVILLFRLFKINPTHQNINLSKHPLFLGICFLILMGYSYKTISRNMDWKDNSTLFENDVKLAPNSSRVHAHYGSEIMTRAEVEENMAKKQRMFQVALTEFQKALSIYPDYHMIYNEIGIIHHKNKEYERALMNFEKVLEKVPDNVDTYHNMGLVFTDLEKYEEALKYYNKAVELDTNYSQSYINIANSYYELGDIDKAIFYSFKAQKLEPDNKNIFNNLGILYHTKGKQLVQLAKEQTTQEAKNQVVSQALGYLNEALRVYPQSKTTYNEIGNAYFELEGYASAIENYRMALAIDGEFIEAYHNLAYAHFMREHYDLAITYFKDVMELDSTYIRAYVNLSALYFQTKKYENAIVYAKKGLKLDPDQYMLYYNLSIIYNELGEIQLSQKMYNKYEEEYGRIEAVTDTTVQQ